MIKKLLQRINFKNKSFIRDMRIGGMLAVAATVYNNSLKSGLLFFLTFVVTVVAFDIVFKREG